MPFNNVNNMLLEEIKANSGKETFSKYYFVNFFKEGLSKDVQSINEVIHHEPRLSFKAQKMELILQESRIELASSRISADTQILEGNQSKSIS